MRYTRVTRHAAHMLHLDDGSECELDYEPCMTDYGGTLAQRVDDKLVVAYLTYDHDTSNPLDDCDGMGRVIGRGKYQTRNHSESDLFEALGLDRYGDPDHSLVEELVDQAWKAYIEGLPDEVWESFINELGCPAEDEYRREYINKWRDELSTTDAYRQGSAAYAVMRANDYISWHVNPNNDQCRAAADLLDFDVEKKTEELYRKAIEEGRIGDRDAVMLDVYDHSGLHWSISGGGMQCRWDTSTGAGVWLPDDEARSEIDRRAPVYATTYIRQTPVRLHGGGNRYQLVDTQENHSIALSDDWSDLWKMAEKYAEAAGDLTPTQLAIGRRCAAEELAQQALDEYNAWLSGDCYGCVVQVFDKVSEDDGVPVWEDDPSEQDACWGYVGSDYAKETLMSEFFKPRVGDPAQTAVA